MNTVPSSSSKNASVTLATIWRKPRAPFVVAVFLLLVAVAGGLFYLKNQDNSQTLTLFYNDGKTVLWQAGQPEGGNAAFIAYVRNQLALHTAKITNQKALGKLRQHWINSFRMLPWNSLRTSVRPLPERV